MIDGQELEQTQIWRLSPEEGLQQVDVATFVEDMTCRPDARARKVRMKITLSHKHLFATKSFKMLSDKWQAEYIRYEMADEVEVAPPPQLDADELAMIEESRKRKAAAAAQGAPPPKKEAIAASAPSAVAASHAPAAAAVVPKKEKDDAAAAAGPAEEQEGDEEEEDDEEDGEGASE